MAQTEFQKQLAALKPDKRKRKVLLPARHPVRIEQQYAKMLRGIIDGINAELKTRIADELKAEIAAREDGYRADDLSAVLRTIRSLATGNIPGLSFVRNIGDSIRSAIDGNWQKAINQAIGVNVALPGTDMSANIDAWAEENTALITNLTQSYLSKITTTVNSGFRDGLSWRDISKNIKAETGVAKRRADLIARDQVATMNMQVTKQRAKDLEIKQFVWRTMEDQRVRGNPSGLYPKAKPSHYARNGKTYNWSDGAGAHDTFPGQAINCRCYASNVIEF
jgi:SPP1 gp7 family putative phage head morphogenesis protein